jgi:hypothetical protein
LPVSQYRQQLHECTGGELGIRTPGPVTVNSFQDCRNRPLCQLSGAKVSVENVQAKKNRFFYLRKALVETIKPGHVTKPIKLRLNTRRADQLQTFSSSHEKF